MVLPQTARGSSAHVRNRTNEPVNNDLLNADFPTTKPFNPMTKVGQRLNDVTPEFLQEVKAKADEHISKVVSNMANYAYGNE